MYPTITKELISSFLNDWLTFNLGAFLIYYPELGNGSNLTEEQYQLRLGITMQEAVSREIGGVNLNGYQRFFPTNDDLIVTNTYGYTKIKTSFKAIDGEIGPFTHLALARNVLRTGASSLNGNNRGDYTGQLILTQPCVDCNQIIRTIPNSVTYESVIPIKFLAKSPIKK